MMKTKAIIPALRSFLSEFLVLSTVALSVVEHTSNVWGQTPEVGTDWQAYTSMREINQIHVDSESGIWAATLGGVLHYNQETQQYSRYTRLDGLAGNNLLSVTQDEQGHLWFGSDRQGLSRFRPESGVFDPPFLEFRDRRIVKLLAIGNQLYVGTDQGISLFLIDAEEVKETYRNLGGLTRDSEITGLGVLNNILFAGTPSGIAWADLNQPNLQDPDSWKSRGGISNIVDVLASDEGVFMAGPFGVFAYLFEEDRVRLEFADEPATSLGLMAGQIIVATNNGKFFERVSKTNWKQLLGYNITGIRDISDSGGSLWLATDTGLSVIGSKLPPPSKEPAKNRFFDMELLSNGELWVASVPDDHQESYGVYQLNEQGWTVFDEDSGMPNNDLVAVETDSDGRIWIGSWGGGVSVRVRDRWFRINQKNSPLIGIGTNKDFVAISDIGRDIYGNMWVVNVLGGIVVLDKYPIRQSLLIPQKSIGLETDIHRVRFSGDKLIWISSRTEGLAVLDNGGTTFDGSDDMFAQINTAKEPQLTSNRVFDLLTTDNGTVWVATNNGLNSFTGSFSRATGLYTVTNWKTYLVSDGLPSNEINTLAEDAMGNIWVGSEEGLTRISPLGSIDFTFTKSNSGLIDNRVKSLLFDGTNNALWIGTFDGLSRLILGTSAGPNQKTNNGIKVGPNPFYPRHIDRLTFKGLALGSSLAIYRPDGQLVIYLPGEPSLGTITWSGQNKAGFLVGSGIYIYVAKDTEGNVQRGKIAVVNGVSSSQ